MRQFGHGWANDQSAFNADWHFSNLPRNVGSVEERALGSVRDRRRLAQPDNLARIQFVDSFNDCQLAIVLKVFQNWTISDDIFCALVDVLLDGRFQELIARSVFFRFGHCRRNLVDDGL